MFKTKEGGGSKAFWTMFKKTADLVVGGTTKSEPDWKWFRWGREKPNSGPQSIGAMPDSYKSTFIEDQIAFVITHY